MNTRRVLTDGTLLPESTALGPDLNVTYQTTAMAAGTTGALVAYRRTGVNPQGLFAVAIDSGGAASSVPVALAANTVAANPDVAFDGENFLVTYEQRGDVFSIMVDEAGATASSVMPVSNAAADQVSASVAFVRGGYSVVFRDQRHLLGALYTQRVDLSGMATSTTSFVNDLVVADRLSISSPHIASVNTRALVAYVLAGDVWVTVLNP